ncbi:MAG: hypothetical protein H7175_10415, partial [Burkholderiales bacterium]|nr:hypothetical protein [Anaerolineae bacterium]
LKLLRGEEVYTPAAAADAAHLTRHWQEALEPDDEEGYGYDVQFLMRGEGMDVSTVRATIDAMGWSTLVVGSDKLIKVHVHVHDPGQPISYAISSGAALDDVVVENMQLQYHHYVEERAAREAISSPDSDRFVESDVVVITVASGPGFRRLFSEELESARVIDGGQTMNPSTEDFLKAIDSLPNTCIVILPNNKNIYMAAQQAATLAEGRGKRVRVVPSRTLPQGVSAMFAYNNLARSGDVDEIAASMTEAMPNVVTLEVTTATRTVELDDIAITEGQLIGLLDDKIVTVGEEMTGIVRDLLQKAFANQRELVTIYYGCDVDEAQAETLVEALAEEFDGPEFEIVGGGQTLYPYIISVE